MLLRQIAEGVIAISQPTHAWISGQLARCWGSSPEQRPREEVYVAAALHDIGFLAWEQAPVLNPRTGLPHTFMDLPVDVHLEIWSHGIQQMLRYGRYPALLVSRHFAALSRKQYRSRAKLEKRAIREFLKDQQAFQATLLTSLRNDFYYEAEITDEVIERDSRLLSVWDWMSLQLCLGQPGGEMATGPGSKVRLCSLQDDAGKVLVRPWPFHCSSLELFCEGRHLLRTFNHQTAFLQAFRAAAPVRLRIELVQATPARSLP